MADIYTDKERTQAYLKLLNIEDIAREALCATLARLLGLPITQAYYVIIDSSYVDGQGMSNEHNVAFGLRNDCQTFAIQNAELDNLVNDWKEPYLTDCAVFDEWIFNRDRLPKNVRYDITKVYWLIDHDEALPNYASPETPANSPVLRVLSQSKSEFELWRLRDDAMRRVDQYRKIDWDKVVELLRMDNLPGSEIYYARYIDFLRKRLPAMHDIITTSLGIQQKYLGLEDRSAPFGKSEEET